MYLAVYEILKWTEHQCPIQPRTVVPVPVLKDWHKEGPISQGMEHMLLSVSISTVQMYNTAE